MGFLAFSFIKTKKLNFIPMKDKINKTLKNKYCHKPVKNHYYSIIKIKEDSEIKELTLEEFRNKEAGMVWMDNKTGKLMFKNDET
jgi:hypothetical protein